MIIFSPLPIIKKIKIKGWGIISVFSKGFFQDIFLVEKCNINLLSISKFCKELNYEVIFKIKSVIFQDLFTKEKISERFSKKWSLCFE
jgi:hypothetical protein